jgi:hypothetical protein
MTAYFKILLQQACRETETKTHLIQDSHLPWLASALEAPDYIKQSLFRSSDGNLL